MTARPGRCALLVVDVQHDFLERAGLQPEPSQIVAACARLLTTFRAARLPVAHVRTRVRPDGTDAMAHRRADGRLRCVAGSPGAEPPADLVEAPGEYVAIKQHYRGFADPGLDGWLRDRGVSRVVIAGLYTHACVRETALDAYERGYEVVIAADAIGSDDPSHADATFGWLTGRAATFRCTDEIVGTLEPSDVPAPVDVVDQAVAAAARAQVAWARRAPAERAAFVRRWSVILRERRDRLAHAICVDVGKPIGEAEAEADRAVAHVESALRLVDVAATTPIATGVDAHTRPVGVVGLVMPWNNPLALPVAKISAALVLGDAIVLKPAPPGSHIADLIGDSLAVVGLPTDLVRIAHGGSDVGAALVRADHVAAIAVTGSIATGRAIAEQCARLGRPLQAELGGNNAAIVLPDADLADVVGHLARNAFSFAGQRCTAIRRFVVDRSILAEFTTRLVASTTALRIGDPLDRSTEIGPLISTAARDRVHAEVEQAVRDGAHLWCGGRVPHTHREGAYYEPTVLEVGDPAARIVQAETFGPVAVIQPADSEEHAIALANGVAQGLVLAVCTADAAAAARVLDAAHAGIVQWGPDVVPIHPDAPFGGWKASGYGPPEHGRWDAQYLAHTQARYRRLDGT